MAGKIRLIESKSYLARLWVQELTRYCTVEVVKQRGALGHAMIEGFGYGTMYKAFTDLGYRAETVKGVRCFVKKYDAVQGEKQKEASYETR